MSEKYQYSQEIKFAADAPGPAAWLRFLGSTIGEESQIILQEWFGYCLTRDTSFQRVLILEGSARTSKDVAIRALRMLLPDGVYDHRRLQDLGRGFSDSSLQYKFVSLLDMPTRGPVSDGSTERLLSIVEESEIQIERKGLRHIMKKLDTRFMIDADRAKWSRSIKWSDDLDRRVLRVQFGDYERMPEGESEDTVIAGIRSELPGLLNWAIAGLERLNRAGKFTCLRMVDARL